MARFILARTHLTYPSIILCPRCLSPLFQKQRLLINPQVLSSQVRIPLELPTSMQVGVWNPSIPVKAAQHIVSFLGEDDVSSVAQVSRTLEAVVAPCRQMVPWMTIASTVKLEEMSPWSGGLQTNNLFNLSVAPSVQV